MHLHLTVVLNSFSKSIVSPIIPCFNSDEMLAVDEMVLDERYVNGVTKRYIFAFQYNQKHTLRVYGRQGSTHKKIYDIVSPGSKNDCFGGMSSGISHNNNFLVVGAYYEQKGKGAAYIYHIKESDTSNPFPFAQKLEPILEQG